MRSTLARVWQNLFGTVAEARDESELSDAPRQVLEAIAGHRLDGLARFTDKGASPAAIEHLKSIAPVALPESYLALLRLSNGGEVPLAVNPFTFCLESAEQVAKNHFDSFTREYFPELFFIAGTGGCGRIAFDLRGPEPYSVVTLDMCGGDLEDIIVIAPSFDAMLQLLGRESEGLEEWDDDDAD
jgi:hypothetical protein